MRLSIITVNYNNLIGLRRTLSSFNTLDYKNFDIEHVFVDNHSSDGSLQEIQNFARTRACVKISSDGDVGVFDAMNKGVAICSGNSVLFMNSGDEIKGENLASFDFSNEIVIYGTVFKYPNGRTKYVRCPKRISFLFGLPFCHQSVIVARQILINHPFSLNTMYSDYNFFLSIKEKKYQIIDLPLSKYEVGGMSDLNSFYKLIDFLSINYQHYKLLTLLPALYLTLRVIKFNIKKLL